MPSDKLEREIAALKADVKHLCAEVQRLLRRAEEAISERDRALLALDMAVEREKRLLMEVAELRQQAERRT